MNLHNLKPAENSTHRERRIGRGQGSGKGGTSTRGNKGAQSRSGYSRKIGFEGGQMPIYRILPKRGFKNINRVEYNAINVSTLQRLAEKNITDVNLQVLIDNGLAKKRDRIAILAKGELTAKVNVTADKFSAKAKEAIEKAGGTVVLLNAPKETPAE
ncbi:MAG: 50S ribosomal protein L15 [Bacteroidales bacterium]|jgi:large subunit ribosomal protein L15|nr:50S ribosomal protein L15 [Bacteroidales bacterium]MCR4858300.1 50S ribosomal protein L15 [Bacteroidales bacterium]